MTFATTWVGVDDVDQLTHGVFAVANDQRWFAACGGDELVADHQQAVITAWQEAFNQHFFTASASRDECSFDAFFSGDVDGDAFALVAIAWFDDHGQSNFLRCSPSIVGADHRATQWHRHACCVQ